VPRPLPPTRPQRWSVATAGRPKVEYAGMMQYDGDLKIPKLFLVTPPAISRTMGELLCHVGVAQLAISETQKFGSNAKITRTSMFQQPGKPEKE